MQDSDKIKVRQQRKACFVVGTNIPDTELTDAEVIAGYKGQSAAEGGFKFLKDPVFFVSSLWCLPPRFWIFKSEAPFLCKEY